MDEGDERDHLGLGKIVAKFIAFQLVLGGQVNPSLDEGSSDFLGLGFNHVVDFMLVHGRPGNSEFGLDGNLVRQSLDVVRIGVIVEEPRIGRHIGTFRNLAWVEEMIEVPVITPFAGAHELVFLALRILDLGTAFTGKVGTGAFGSPLIGMVKNGLSQMGIIIDDTGAAVAHHIALERADHLGMAEVTALRDEDIATGEFQRSVEFLEATLDVFLAIDDEGGDDLHGPTDGCGDEDKHREG